jgi:2'-5' RNA ligase
MEAGTILPGLKAALDHKLEGIGFPPEDRKFRPHLTLARIKIIRDRDLLGNLLREYSGALFQQNRIEELNYYESILRPEGPEYIPLRKASFNIH